MVDRYFLLRFLTYIPDLGLEDMNAAGVSYSRLAARATIQLISFGMICRRK